MKDFYDEALQNAILQWTKKKANSTRQKQKGKGKAVPLQAWTGPEGSRKLRLPDFVTTTQDGGKVVNLSNRPPLSQGHSAIGRILYQ